MSTVLCTSALASYSVTASLRGAGLVDERPALSSQLSHRLVRAGPLGSRQHHAQGRNNMADIQLWRVW